MSLIFFIKFYNSTIYINVARNLLNFKWKYSFKRSKSSFVEESYSIFYAEYKANYAANEVETFKSTERC